MAPRTQQLNIGNIEGGELLADVNKALTEIQDAVLGKKAKASITVKITVDTTKSDSIGAVTAELSKSVPKMKRSGLYNRGAHYLVAEPAQAPKGEQAEIPEVGNVVDINRKSEIA